MIRYAQSGGVAIAYTVRGSGSPDLVFVHGFAGNIEIEDEDPHFARFYDQLASFSRLILFDRRGTGLSDRLREPAPLETRMDDLRAVLDAAGSGPALLFGTFEAASMCLLFAATYPERTIGLVLYNPVAKGTWSHDYPWAPPEEEWRQTVEEVARTWGTRDAAAAFVRTMASSHADDEEFIEGIARLWRLSASPRAAATIRRMAADVDVRDVLPAVRVPALIANMPSARAEAEYLTSQLPMAQRFELRGPDYLFYLQSETLLPEVASFASSLDVDREPDTVLATVLFTDVVDSTAQAATVGDRQWGRLVEQHHATVRRQLIRFRGTEVDTAGDGFFATFDGPIRAIRCAAEIIESTRGLGLRLRAGVHTGECELIAGKVGGIAVNIGARIAAQAAAGQVLVSSTVKDLVAGSSLTFSDEGIRELKGVPGQWHLYAVSTT